MVYSTTHEEKLSQEELDRIKQDNEQTLADYYRYRMPDSHNVKNVSQ